MLDVLRAMDKKTPPFESVLAGLAGIAPSRVQATIVRGMALAEAGDRGQDLSARMALEIRQAQAVWKAEALRQISDIYITRDQASAARQLQWILERMDRDTFDITIPRKNSPMEPSKSKAHRVSPEAAQKLLAS